MARRQVVLFEHARKPLRRYGRNAAQGLNAEWQKGYTFSPDSMVPMVRSADLIAIVVIGGTGPNSAWFPHRAGPYVKRLERHWRRSGS